MKKTIHPTKKKTTRPKKETKWYDQFYDLFTFKQKPVSDIYLDRLAQDLREFADDPDTLRMNDFYQKKGMRKGDFYRFVGRHEGLKSAHEYTMERIASKRELGALFSRKTGMDPKTAHMTLSKYCDVFREMEIWRAKLRNENEKSTGGKIEVVLTPFEKESSKMEKPSKTEKPSKMEKDNS